MDGPPFDIAQRRARRRSRPRPRGGAGTVALVALLVTLLAGCDGFTRSAGRISGAPARPQRHRNASLGGRPFGVRRAARTGGSATIRRLLGLGLPIYCGGHHGNEVAFTFDDGPGPYTNLALRKLAGAHAGATFFVVGRSMDNYRGYLPRELKVGAIGDHTYTHPELTALPPSQITWQLNATARKIKAQSGEHVELFRPPYELHNAIVDRIAHRLGLLEILWNVDSQDSLGADYAQIITNVEAGLRPGAIILMHENRGQTIRALTTLLPELHRRHLRSVSVPDLLASDPPSATQIRQGPKGCGVTAKSHRSGGH